MKEILEVDEECYINYTDGTGELCQHCPTMKFADCEPGYGSHGDCPKWNYYHRKESCVK